MILRKINAGISLLITLLLLIHAIFHSVRMLFGMSVSGAFDFVPWVMVGLMVIHVFISIDLVVSTYMENENCKCKHYAKMNVSTLVQRISGAMLVLFSALHIAGATKVLQPPQVVHAILPPLFFALSLAHVSVSVGKAFITLGIGSAKVIRIADICVKVLCGVTLISAVVGFYLYSILEVG